MTSWTALDSATSLLRSSVAPGIESSTFHSGWQLPNSSSDLVNSSSGYYSGCVFSTIDLCLLILKIMKELKEVVVADEKSVQLDVTKINYRS